MLALNGYYISFLTFGVLSMAMNPIGQGSDSISDVGRPRRNVVPREVEGVRLERLRALRNSRAGYLGAMNRSQKDIDLLLMDQFGINNGSACITLLYILSVCIMFCYKKLSKATYLVSR
jgi:hypothetical protein